MRRHGTTKTAVHHDCCTCSTCAEMAQVYEALFAAEDEIIRLRSLLAFTLSERRN